MKESKNSTGTVSGAANASNIFNTSGGKTKSNAIQVPSISLPNGGGAIKGIDEKFSVNAVNGTSSFTVPLPFSPARGANPALSLSYNSGNGNGIFGLGWNIGLSSIARKTDKALPEYKDEIDSDTFLLSEAEDLVPEFQKETDKSFSLDADGDYIIHEKESPDGLYLIRFYRPRTEGLFARVERWREKNTGIIKWRVITKDNLTTLFGWSDNARISDPQDATRIAEWLPEFVFDDKGNCSQYIYKAEDAAGFNLSLLHNRNRRINGQLTYTNCYLEKILYGNKTPYRNFGDAFPPPGDYFFSTVFDYGEYDQNSPYEKIRDWTFRPDAFSEYKTGFEIRTTRLCRRVLLFHHFTGTNEYNGLVKSVDFEYDTTSEQDFTFLKSITSCGYIKKTDGSYSSKKLPAIELEYQQHAWNKEVKTISSDDLVHAPSGIDGERYQFTDLFNEGLSGILTEQANGWYYKHNLGGGKFTHAELVSPKPSFIGLGTQLELADLDADGGKQVVNYETEPKGYFELDDENEWQPYRKFKSLPTINLASSNVRMLDLNGDGKAEILVVEDHVFTWYSSEGRQGFSSAQKTTQSFDEEKSPQLLFSNEDQSIFLAGMSGSGLTDIVRIKNGEVCYWPNLGYGKFGAKIAMDNAPVFDHPDSFNASYIRLADIDGSGTSDIIYLGKNKFTCWMNLSGNSFTTTPFEIDAFPEIYDRAKISVTDLLGTGVSCIVWSSSLSKNSNVPLRYIDLMDSKKPHLLIAYKNNLGKELSLEYAPSTRFYLDDKLNDRPWVTKLPFPVHCIAKTETRDIISGYRFVSSYKYHHGYYDHAEREFRGFGMVEQKDAEHFEHWVKGDASNIVDAELHQQPAVAKKWTHTGAFISREKILRQFEHEYWHVEMNRQGFPVVHNEATLRDASIIAAEGIPASVLENMSAEEWQQALRACKGMALRSELFAEDAPATGATTEEISKQLTPYMVSTHNCLIEMIQPKGKNKFAVFIVRESEAFTYYYERNIADPRSVHLVNLKFDEYSNVLESADVIYPRILTDATLPLETQQEQKRTTIMYSQYRYTNDVTGNDVHRLRLPSEMKTFEIKGLSKTGDYYTLSDFENIAAIATEISYPETDREPAPGIVQKRVTEHLRTNYYRNDLTGALPLHQIESPVIPFENYQLAYTPELISDVFGAKVNAAILEEGKFVHSEGDTNWWVRSGITQLIAEAENVSDAANRFYKPVSYTDPYGAKTSVKYYGNYFLFVEETKDALGNISKVDQFNFRTLSPRRMRDVNNNLSEAIMDELGIVKAMAVLGKGNEADDLAGLNEETTITESTQIAGFFNASDSVQLISQGKELLQHATKRYCYDLDSYMNTGRPAVMASVTREEHFQKNNESPVQISFEYSNGVGQIVMKKDQAEPGLAKQVIVQEDNSIIINEVDTAAAAPRQLRWVGNGRTILNNKGTPVKQYEPYFSISHHYEDYKELVETGVTPIMYYDAMSRLVKTELPNGSFSKTIFDSWKKKVFDCNDTILESSWYMNRSNRLIDAQLLAEGKDPAKEKAAADKSAKHANTPNTVHLDTIGRPLLAVSHIKNVISEADEFHFTKIKLDAEGNLRKITDARGNTIIQYKYDILGTLVYHNGMDAGQRWVLLNILGNSLRTWDERNHEFQYSYDILHRPVQNKVLGGDGTAPIDHIFERVFYGESLLLPDRSNEAMVQSVNALGKPIKIFDTGGLLESLQYDFRGEPLTVTRRLFSRYKEIANWTDASLDNDIENTFFTVTTEKDALGRITRQVNPDGSIVTASYNETGLLHSETVAHADPAITTVYIKDVDYNEKGQRSKIIYGNDVTTKYYYDKETFLLNRLESKRQNNDPLMDLYYTSDPLGNITHIEDKNIPVTFFGNQKITGVSEYTYDARYQLISATGRENNAALVFGNQDNHDDAPFIQQLNPGDPMAMRNYLQEFRYDETGNMIQMRQIASGNNWTREYVYENNTNRLISTQVGSAVYQYPHHARHGFMMTLPHLNEMNWNFKDQLIKTIRQSRTDGGIPETTWYQYDRGGRRIRKVTENQAAPGAIPAKKEERIYIGDYELYKKHTGANEGLERVSFRLADEECCFAMIETRNEIDDGTEKHLVRYQLHNHLGSATLELNESAQVISYEEFHPFGTTAYLAKNATIRAAAKRYRYTGMERDEETDLNYHGARYYLPWLGRWLSSDPGGIEDGLNLYAYVNNNPIILTDTSGFNGSVYLEAGKQWEKHILDQIAAKIPIVQQVTVFAMIDGKKVETVLDGLGISDKGWVIIEAKLSPGTKLSDAQRQIREYLKTGKPVQIAATDAKKVAELQSKLNVSAETRIATTRYAVVHRGNAAAELAKIRVVPKGTGSVMHAAGNITFHTEKEMQKIAAALAAKPGTTAQQAITEIRKGGQHGSARIGTMLVLAVSALGVVYALRQGEDLQKAMKEAGQEAIITGVIFAGGNTLDLVLNYSSCNGEEDQKNKIALNFLAKNYPDMVTDKIIMGINNGYEIKPGYEDKLEEAKEFLFNTTPEEVPDPEEEEFDPCRRSRGGSGAGPVSACQ